MNFSQLLSHLPSWVNPKDLNSVYWFVGFSIGGTVRLFRTALRWVKRYGVDDFGKD